MKKHRKRGNCKSNGWAEYDAANVADEVADELERLGAEGKFPSLYELSSLELDDSELPTLHDMGQIAEALFGHQREMN